MFPVGMWTRQSILEPALKVFQNRKEKKTTTIRKAEQKHSTKILNLDDNQMEN